MSAFLYCIPELQNTVFLQIFYVPWNFFSFLMLQHRHHFCSNESCFQHLFIFLIYVLVHVCFLVDGNYPGNSI